jgi:membrane protein
MSFRAIWKYKPPLVSGGVRTAILTAAFERAMGLALVLMTAVLLLVAVAVIGTLQWLGAHLEKLPWLGGIDWLIALPSTFFMVALTFAMFFRFLPPVRVRWRHVWIAALVCAIAYMVATEFLTMYGVFFPSHFGALGAVGGLLLVMLWMNVVSQILFYGAELCKVMSDGDLAPVEM